MNPPTDLNSLAWISVTALVLLISSLFIKDYLDRKEEKRLLQEKITNESILRTQSPNLAELKWLEKKRARETWLESNYKDRVHKEQEYQTLLHEELGAYMVYLLAIRLEYGDKDYLNWLLEHAQRDFVPKMPEWRRRT